MCPHCGGKPEKTDQNLATGDVVYTCAAGHSWPSGEKTAPASPGQVEEEQETPRKSGERPGGEGTNPQS